MDFTDDPFRDYRYEDPFNIAFDDEPEETAVKTSSSDDPFSSGKKDTTRKKEDSFDPFGLHGRQSVPLPMSDPFFSSSGRLSVPLGKSGLISEDQQLAWAAKESIKLEEDRRKRQIQEQADLELAIALSKVENKTG